MYCRSCIHETNVRSLVGMAAATMSDLINVLQIHKHAYPEVIPNVHPARHSGDSCGSWARPVGGSHRGCEHLRSVKSVRNVEGREVGASRSPTPFPPSTAKSAAVCHRLLSKRPSASVQLKDRTAGS